MAKMDMLDELTETKIKFTADGRALYTLNYPTVLISARLGDLKKLFHWMVWDAYTETDNARAVIATQEQIYSLQVRAEGLVKKACTAYANGFRSVNDYRGNKKKAA